MIKFEIDKIVKDSEGHVVYIHVYDSDTKELLETASFVWKGKDDFKDRLKKKTSTLRADYAVKKTREIEVNQALRELEEEVT